MNTMKAVLSEHCPIDVTQKMLDALRKWMITYEIRDKNPDAFNTPLIGVDSAYFFDSDGDQLYHILDVNASDFLRWVRTCPDIKHDANVIGDPYNLLTMWGVHCFLRSGLNSTQKTEGCLIMLKMMHYRFFTSLVKRRLKHGAKRDVMQATIDGLSMKFDIMNPNTPTWKTVIEARSMDIIAPGSIHYKDLLSFSPDKRIAYTISDAQSRLRSKLRIIISEYYENDKARKSIGTTSMTMDTEDGAVMKDIESSYETMTTLISNKVLNLNQFIKHDVVALITKIVPNVRPDMLRTALTRFSAKAAVQYKRGEKDLVDNQGNIVGYHKLIDNIIQRTYRVCLLEKINMRNSVAILLRAVDIYRSSRISDQGILQNKSSVSIMIDEMKISEREATRASLKIAFILYIIALTFNSR